KGHGSKDKKTSPILDFGRSWWLVSDVWYARALQLSMKTAGRTAAMNFESLLKFGVDQGATAIHLQAESSPQLRIGGLIRNVEAPPLKAEDLRTFLMSIAPRSVSEDLDRSLAAGSSFSA